MSKVSLSGGPSPTTDDQLRTEVVPTSLDPVAAASRLAASGMFADYMVYEVSGEWIVAGDALGAVELDTEELRCRWADDVRRRRWVGRPAEVLDAALNSFPLGDRHAYGWIGFEFGAYMFGAWRHLRPGTLLAHIIVPRVEIRLTRSGALVSGADRSDVAGIRRVLLAPEAPPRSPRPVDVSWDRSRYRSRVAAAVDEIRNSRYRKVILSRNVDVGFPVDLPATYRLARAHNNPRRSFLLRMGDLGAAGFSPELVVAVDEGGVVTTEPLAGTRAFGRGAAPNLAARVELESDPKEIVEHAVSVRTSMAEISSVAAPDSAVVSDFMTVRERGSVQHLASTVRGKLSPRRTRWDALEALFPAVTASGLPKTECIDAIFRLDVTPRGLYSGAVVTISPGRALEATLVLRAVYQCGGTAWLRAGAGVIGGSRPEREFEETCEKFASVAPYLVPAD